MLVSTRTVLDGDPMPSIEGRVTYRGCIINPPGGTQLPIQVLDDEVASAIAAGEVVERPVSVVKELIENSLDAGAQRIEINLEEGGKRLIEVSDDGHGIPGDEVKIAVQRYSTSKLRSLDDLEAIHTLGFRGEALASIGAVSRMQLTTRTREEDRGTCLQVEGGAISTQTGTGAREGTRIQVRDLFFNVPARKKFLKTDLTERRRITRLVTRYAMAYPEIAFQLRTNDKVTFHSSGKGELQETMAAIYGVDIGKRLIHLPTTSHAGIQVEGFISPPDISRSNRREITTFVNGRWVQDSSLVAAVIQAYHTLLMVGRYPIAIIALQVPADRVDVNVHPTKAEIRLAEPDKVFSILQRVVRSTLLGFAPPPDLDLPSPWQKTPSWPDYPNGETLFPRPNKEVAWESRAEEWLLQPAMPQAEVPLLRAVGQVGACYLVAEGPDGLYLVDQHAAHERILFERWMNLREKQELEVQSLLEPITIELGAEEGQLMEAHLDALQELGFDLEPFGARTFRLRAVPVVVASMDPERATRVVLEEFEEDETPLEGFLEGQIAARICKRAAIKAGQVLSLQEQQSLLRDLERCESPRTCPHGRPTMIHLSVDSLERQFGRKG